ncbi:MAG TPA: oxygenase MpaB family protein [Longimicrobiaceae bacterium]|nr:oxygenase MpaB family protein [Longimicrobiaceae bacterium]
MEPFVRPGSIVRRVWGDADLVLLVFAGAAAEFALNRAVDWLFFTGELPRDPLGRLFSTAAYAQEIALADRATAERAMQRIRSAHAAVEQARGGRIPDWAHRDVLYLLVDYSERAFEALHRPLDEAERRELWEVFRRVGEGLHVPDLPPDYAAWRADRELHLERDLAFGPYTSALYEAYRRHLGPWRFHLLRQVQAALVPERVRRLLGLARRPWLRRLLPLYPAVARLGFRSGIQRALIPPAYLAAVRRLDAREETDPGGKPLPHSP